MQPKHVAIPFALIAVFVATAVHAAPAPKKEKEPATRPAVKSFAPQQGTFHLTGVFDNECEINLRTVLAQIPGVVLTKLDMIHAEATFTYDPAAAFPTTRPDRIQERFDQLLKQASGNVLSAKPASTTPKEKLKQIDLPVVFLHCRACGLALHEMLMKQDGVEQVLVDLKQRKVQATIDPEKTSKETLVAFLKKREVKLEQ